MAAKVLYASIPGLSEIISVSVSTSHSASTSTAQIVTTQDVLNIGDNITIDLGYQDSHGIIFKGYVKNINRQVPNNLYTVIAKDDMVRALDFFIVPTNPNDSFKRRNISAESLVQQVLELAGLTNYTYTPTSFTFATRSGNEVEVKLVSSYDFCKMISDLLTWHLWADETGLIHFENRKPYVMLGTSGQPGDVADVPINPGFPLTYATSLNANLSKSDHDLRNRVVVHGYEDIFADASSGTSLNPLTGNQEQIMPVGFFKSMALISPIIDSTSMAQTTADYNLDLYNKLTVAASFVAEGNYRLLARKVIEVNDSYLGITGNWYIFMAEHNWGREGYLVNLELRK